MHEELKIFRGHDPFVSEYRQYDCADIVQKAHDLFQRRMGFGSFNSQNLRVVQQALEAALRASPENDQVRYELAYTLTQNCANESALNAAEDILLGLRMETIASCRLKALLQRFKINADINSDGYTVARVNWAINNECPMVCKGCYNPFSTAQISIQQAKLIADKLAEAGVEMLTVSGGDPILWPPIQEFSEYVHSLGLRLGLDSTGYSLTEDMLRKFKGVVSQMSLPLDGSTDAIQRAFRKSPDKTLVARFRRSLELCDKVGFGPIRVHTVVSRHNIDDLTNIAEIITRHPCVEAWLLFEWWGRRATKKVVSEMSVTSQQVSAAHRALAEQYPNLNIQCLTPESRECVNFFIRNNGQVVTFGLEEGEEFLIGDLLEQEVSEVLASPILNKQGMHRLNNMIRGMS